MNCAYGVLRILSIMKDKVFQFIERSEKSWRSQFTERSEKLSEASASEYQHYRPLLCLTYGALGKGFFPFVFVPTVGALPFYDYVALV